MVGDGDKLQSAVIVPRHIALVMDGNGRWAKMRGKERCEGHVAGVNALRVALRAAAGCGVEYLTAYTFSTENWNRPEEEVRALMGLFVAAIMNEMLDLMTNNIRLLAIGDFSRLPEDVRESLEKGIRETAANTGLTLVLALSYSSRWEMTDAIRRLARKVRDGSVEPEDINVDLVSDHLSTAGIPDPDLFIRTGGEKRISNFLMWQMAYTELFFTDTLWPDFDADCLKAAIEEYSSRERRFGKTSEQIALGENKY